ncbi:chromosome segregation protein SMC [Alkalilimnicola ehrlichii]|uniref:Chromosome partition protein Smc n=1 Tax=Alkalilimnicola ehrlichii TaxID=351052 RepID=A0A3E0WVT4_9GAMM|nr:chromosome segregation protein SMC [Alkalilimnicola ehrlichii]RFA27738.1 chromosome segregation protein SMC [Alkalilimnicola ehrlichii]RFA36928.1 chromosome segregation protein SMC [Alkalilimnicola ehrlichii]
MRLTKIKLAGFKSFVDPTTVVLPSALIGVVGPNGCGKSNIIDCVRWVMGESSAKYLRGESMTDVIFNGSSSRKPVGQASVELVFDNRDGTLGGQYASYNEISVKRQVNRESQSHYYLNGTRCRKRDITDVFLGTGLGPRSYAIIEQGMISRVVEAKPEELRVYLEEAAGISLYKERRRETERRMRDTRENLERLNDVREEVGRQLEKLKRQAETAERYKALKAEERQYRGQLMALRLRDLDRQLEELGQVLQEKETATEAELAKQRESERGIETAREAHAERSELLGEVQARYYSLGSEIARIEQQITHQKELRGKHQEDLDRNQEAIDAAQLALEEDRDKLAELRERLEELEPMLEEGVAAEEEAAERAGEIQERLDEWQARWEQFNRDAAEPVQTAQVERARIEQFERRNQDLVRRRERLQEEHGTIDLAGFEDEIEQLAEEERQLGEQQLTLQEQREEVQQRFEALREQHNDLGEALAEWRGTVQQTQARLTSLETLQQAALGGVDGLQRWLAEQGWNSDERLAQQLDVEPGWERAVEIVLGDVLQAVCTSRLGLDGALLQGPEQGRVTIMEQAPTEAAPDAFLASKVAADWPVRDFLLGVRWAEDMAAARQIQATLAPGESVITRNGVWLGKHWLRVEGGEEAGGGVLERERDIQQLRESLVGEKDRLSEIEAQLEQAKAHLQETEERRDELASALHELERRLSAVSAQLESRRGRVGELQQRRQRLAEEIAEIDREVETGEEELRAARRHLQEALSRSEELEAQREQLQGERDELQERLQDYRERAREQRELRHDLSLKVEHAKTAGRSLEEALERSQGQLERLCEQRESLREVLQEQGDPTEDLSHQREALLEQRLRVEEELSEARAQLGDLEAQLRELADRRTEADREVQSLRQALESLRLKAQEFKVRRQNEVEKLSDLDLELDTLLDALPADAAESEWQQQLERLESRIARLGAINLAAIDEYKALEERKTYLDRQHEDLTEAMETLESAIRRIDRETRTRFKETYDKVNAGMQRIFPRLFGGGQGYLELTGDDLLETGVAIMARPPGKRITNIHLLSGGEKALTAVALVFAIFELNPSPFCMLDEVDAPLDEANVGRFCNLLVEMSQRVQFIFITHNKATMEIAEHLTGVTMHEPGVSRLVMVDVDEAVQLAAV